MKKNILIVDDCTTTRKIISIYLRLDGYNIIGAVDGIDALEKLTTSDVDLIITDLNMPQMDGIELVKSVKSNPVYSKIPIIMLTTEAGEISRTKGKEVGVSTYLTKPVPKDVLRKEVIKLMG
ncbi:MAG: response regulator [Nitrospirota bacterium]